MHVLLVYPNIDAPLSLNAGLASIAGVLKSRGHTVQLLHVNEKLDEVPTTDQLLDEVNVSGAEVVGFSVITQQYGWAREQAEAIREAFPDLVLVVGGVHCTVAPESVQKDKVWDYIGVGECDVAFADLVDRLDAGERPRSMPNFRYLGDGLPVVSPVGAFPCIADLPKPAFEVFRVRDILAANGGWFTVQSSRGCPYSCSYCFNQNIVQRYKDSGVVNARKTYLRHVPVDRLITWLEELKIEYPEIKVFAFDDDLFTVRKSYVLDFCAKYKARIGLPFIVNVHVQFLDEEVARALKDAGCFTVRYGVEHGLEEVRRELLNRRMPNSKIISATRAAQSVGLSTSAFIILGVPGETAHSLLSTLRLVAELRVDKVRWSIFYPFPGTQLHDRIKDTGAIDWDRYSELPNFDEESCLKWTDDERLLLEKVTALAPLWINSYLTSPISRLYGALADEVEGLSRDEWDEKKDWWLSFERKISDLLLEKQIDHYSIRFMKVMAARSSFVLEDRTRSSD